MQISASRVFYSYIPVPVQKHLPAIAGGALAIFLSLPFNKIQEVAGLAGLLGFSYWAYKKTKPLVELPATTQKTAEVQKSIAADVSASSPQRTTKEENPQEAPPLQNSFGDDSRIHEQQTSVSLCGGPVKPFIDPIQLIKIHAAQLKKTNFLRRIKPDAWEGIIDRIAQLNHSITPSELGAFRKGEFNADIFKDPHWIYFAFQAYLEGALDEDTASKLFLYEECIKQAKKSLKIHQLFQPQGKRDESSIALLKSTLNYMPNSYLNDSQFESFLTELSCKNPEQSQFFSITKPLDDSISSVIFDVFPYFRLTPSEREETLMIAPPAFIYSMHRAKWGENTILPEPALGFAEVEKLSNTTKRVVSIPGFDLSPPQTHGIDSPPLALYLHDILYHHAIESANTHRELWAQFALSLNQYPNLHRFIPFILDREFPMYLYSKNGPHNFWLSLAGLASTIGHLFEKEELLPEFASAFAEFYHAYPFQKTELNPSSLEKTINNPLFKRPEEFLGKRFLKELKLKLERKERFDGYLKKCS